MGNRSDTIITLMHDIAGQKTRIDAPGAGVVDKGRKNCANCAIATDATLKGNPASALNSGLTLVVDVEKHFGRTFGSATSITRINAQLSRAGNGSMGVVFGARNGRPGHFFNVVNQRGTIRYLDGQTGGAANLNGFSSFRLLRTN